MSAAAIGIGLIGVGLHGIRYARHIVRDVAEARLVAIARRDRAAGAAQAAELGCAFEPSVEGLVGRADVDAVVVVTPPVAHLDPVLGALAAGKAALVEKPMAATVEEGEALRQAVARTGQPFMVAHTLRYNSVLRAVRAELETLGRIVQVRISQRLEPSSLEWQRAHQASGAGSILLTGVHLFDIVRWLFEDEVAAVFCRSRRVLNPAQEDFFAASVVLARTGIHADLEVSNYTQSRSCRIEVVGEKGQLFGDYWHHRLLHSSGRAARPLTLPPEVFTVEAAVRDFCRRVISRQPLPITAADGLRTLEIAAACYASARTGSPVALDVPAGT